MGDAPNQTLSDILAAYLQGETVRVALYDDSTAFTFDPDVHDTVADVLDGGTTARELQGTAGYTGPADRKTLQNMTFNPDDTDDEGVWDADDVTWTGVESTAAIQGYIFYKQVGGDDSTPADDPIIKLVDDDMADAPASLPLSTNGSDVQVQLNAEGIINTLTP